MGLDPLNMSTTTGRTGRSRRDKWADKTIADMTKLVEECLREIRKAEADL